MCRRLNTQTIKIAETSSQGSHILLLAVLTRSTPYPDILSDPTEMTIRCIKDGVIIDDMTFIFRWDRLLSGAVDEFEQGLFGPDNESLMAPRGCDAV